MKHLHGHNLLHLKKQNGSLSIKVKYDQDSMEAIGFDLGWYPFDSQVFENRLMKTTITGML